MCVYNQSVPTYLSVILSTYNDGKYIAEAVQSILDQTYPYFELIIINDGSTDDTLQILQSFDDPRIILINKENTGLVDSLNYGVSIAKYDWIARMDSDDICESNRFLREIQAIKKSTVIISSQCSIIDSEGSIIAKTHFATGKLGKKLSTLLSLPQIAHPSVIFNKKIFELVEGYDPLMEIAEDCDLWRKMLHYGQLEIIHEPLLRLRKHGSNISTLRRDTQILNEFIGYAKATLGIHRRLTANEYSDIRKHLLESSFYSAFCKHSQHSRLEYIFWHIVRLIYILQSKKLRAIFLPEVNFH